MRKKIKTVISLLVVFVLIASISNFPVTINAVQATENRSYNAVKTIKTAMESGSLPSNNSVWYYSERAIALNSSTGLYEATTTQWDSNDLFKSAKPTYISSGTLPSKLADMLCIDTWRGSDTKNGFAIDNEKIVTFIGHLNGYAPSITFRAPKTGTIRLYSPNNGKIGGAGTGDPYWTLGNSSSQLGLAIYLEDEKIWPSDTDYYILTQGKSSITFPEIYADVTAGENIRIEFMPLKNSSWGFCIASPQVDYHWIEPETQKTSYSAVLDIGDAITNESMPVSGIWSYSERKITLNSTTNLYQTTSFSWIERNLQKVTSPCVAPDTNLKNMMANALCVNEGRGTDTKNGFFIDGDKICQFIGHGNGYAPSITFTAPKNGDVVLSEVGGTITAPGQAALYWTLNDNTKKIGFAIFHNDKKVWPADDEYYIFTQSNRSVSLPEIPLKVAKGDKIRFEVVALNQYWGFFKLSPKVDYLTSDALATEFPAVNTIKNAENNGYLATDDVWCYSECPIAYEEGTGEFRYDGRWTGKYYPTLEWKEIALDQNAWRADLSKVQKAIPKMLYHKADNTVFLGNGFASYKNQVCTYIGAYNMRATALTFNAPYSGMINLYDPNSRKTGAALPNSTFNTLTKGVEEKEIGFAIYLNDQKLWPKDKSFYTFTADEKTITFPNLSKIKVTKGDKIRICFFSRKAHEQMGFCTLSPQVDYTEVSSYNLKYNAADAVKTEIAKGGDWVDFSNELWSYQEIDSTVKNVSYNGKTQSVVLPSGTSWTSPAIKLTQTDWCSMNGGVRYNLQGQMYWYWNQLASDGRGIAYYKDAVVMTVGTGNNNSSLLSSALTYKAPLNGTISLCDPEGGAIGESGVYTYTKHGEKIGLAIYKNNEKLWPADGDKNTIDGYYVLEDGVFDTNTDSYISAGNETIDFPEISNIPVNSGDLIRIVAVPLDMKWKFIRLNPQIEYTSVNEPNWSDEALGIKITKLPEMTRYFTDENFDFSGLKVSVRRANGAINELTLDGSDPKFSYTITEPERSVGTKQVWVNYDDGELKYKESFDIEIRYKKYGDIDADGRIDIFDLTGLKKLLLGYKKGLHEGVADTSGDGVVNIIDLIRLKKYLADVSTQLGPDEQISEEAKSLLKGITVNALGDSYFGGHILGKDSTWLKLFADNHEILLNNYGINGSAISDYRTDLWPMCIRYSSMADDADIIIFEGGHNDACNWIPLGTPDSTDSKTFAGAVNVLISGLKAKYPDAMIIGITSWYVDDNMKKYSDLMLEVCEQRGVPCIDAADKVLTGVDMENEDFRKEYCQAENDHAHLNEKGSALVLPVFEKIIAEEYLKFKSSR